MRPVNPSPPDGLPRSARHGEWSEAEQPMPDLDDLIGQQTRSLQVQVYVVEILCK